VPLKEKEILSEKSNNFVNIDKKELKNIRNLVNLVKEFSSVTVTFQHFFKKQHSKTCFNTENFTFKILPSETFLF